MPRELLQQRRHSRLWVEFFLHRPDGRVQPISLLEAAETAIQGHGAGHVYCRVAGALWLELVRKPIIPTCVRMAANDYIKKEGSGECLIASSAKD